MSVAFIPFYIHFLGNDAFALIGLFVLLQAWLVVLDLVMQSAMAGIIGNTAGTALMLLDRRTIRQDSRFARVRRPTGEGQGCPSMNPDCSEAPNAPSMVGAGSEPNAVDTAVHTGRESEARVRRYPEHREVNVDLPPLPLDSGNPSRCDEQNLKSTTLPEEDGLNSSASRLPVRSFNVQAFRKRLKKIELVVIFIALTVAVGIWFASDWLASAWVHTDWLMAKNLPVEAVAQAFNLLGVMTALQLIESVYVGSLVGLRQHPLQEVKVGAGSEPAPAPHGFRQSLPERRRKPVSTALRDRAGLRVAESRFTSSAIQSMLATLRSLGAVGVLVWVEPTIKAFFIWQGLVSLVTVVLFAGFVYRQLLSSYPITPADRIGFKNRVDLAKQAAGVSSQTIHNPSLKKNVAANYLGQGWRALMSMAFIPLYIRYLGIESYGLIGIFAILQAWLGLLDMGMRPALGREMARFTGGAHDAQGIRDLLRSIEVIGVAISVAVALGIWAASGWLASDWLNAKNLPVDVVAKAFAVMGVVTALQFIESIYASCIAGLQRQVLQNAMTSIMAMARGLGAVGILVWVSPTIEAFFIWQGIISLLNVALFASVVYSTLPRVTKPSRFSKSALTGIWRFAAGMVGINILVLLLTQTDKILLSRLLPLENFAHYSLAGVVAGSLYMLVGPIGAAYYPRFTELVTRNDELALRAVYHQGAQLVTVLMGSAAVVLMLFGGRVLRLWTADPVLAGQVAPLVAVLALGNLCNGLMWMPYQMQLAHGWTSLTIKINSVAVAILVPTILWAVPKYGAMGAAWVWVALNSGYLVFGIYFFHRRLLPTEKWRWYNQDVFIPLVAATVAAGLCSWAMPVNLGRLAEFGVLFISSGCVLMVAVLAAPLVRRQFARHVPGWLKLILARTV